MIGKVWSRFWLWYISTFWAWVLVLTASLMLRRRMSHNNGVTARGKVKVVENPEFPAHDFFEPGREWPCRLRHASVSYFDDAVIQVRATSLKFSDELYESPLDIEMNTGTISLFWSAKNFLEFFMKKTRINGCDFVEFYKKYERGLIAARDGIRNHPETFAQMYYHSQCAQGFTGKDGVLRYVKFRLIPGDRGAETGLIPEAEKTPFWSEDLQPGETRGQNYLKKEYVERVKAAPVTYHLQIQLRDPVAGESNEVFNCNVAWDEAKYPYKDLATVTVDSVMPYEENQLMRYSLSHLPASLSNLPSESWDDYNSVVYMRVKSGPAKAARLMTYKIFGMPKLPPDTRSP